MLPVTHRYHLPVTFFGFSIFVSMSASGSIYVLWMRCIFVIINSLMHNVPKWPDTL